MPDISYTRRGDYFMPDIILSDPLDAKPLDKYGRMRKNYLKRHKPIVYNKMLAHEELYPHCREIQRRARESLDLIMEYFKVRNPQPTEKTDILAWKKLVIAYRLMAEEIIKNDLIRK